MCAPLADATKIVEGPNAVVVSAEDAGKGLGQAATPLRADVDIVVEDLRAQVGRMTARYYFLLALGMRKICCSTFRPQVVGLTSRCRYISGDISI